jgi:hypothetical protein
MGHGRLKGDRHLKNVAVFIITKKKVGFFEMTGDLWSVNMPLSS